MLAGGYSNELEDGAAPTSQFYPWIARFAVSRTSVEPVMQWGVLINATTLINYQVVSVSFDKIMG